MGIKRSIFWIRQDQGNNPINENISFQQADITQDTPLNRIKNNIIFTSTYKELKDISGDFTCHFRKKCPSDDFLNVIGEAVGFILYLKACYNVDPEILNIFIIENINIVIQIPQETFIKERGGSFLAEVYIKCMTYISMRFTNIIHTPVVKPSVTFLQISIYSAMFNARLDIDSDKCNLFEQIKFSQLAQLNTAALPHSPWSLLGLKTTFKALFKNCCHELLHNAISAQGGALSFLGQCNYFKRNYYPPFKTLTETSYGVGPNHPTLLRDFLVSVISKLDASMYNYAFLSDTIWPTGKHILTQDKFDAIRSQNIMGPSCKQINCYTPCGLRYPVELLYIENNPPALTTRHYYQPPPYPYSSLKLLQGSLSANFKFIPPAAFIPILMAYLTSLATVSQGYFVVEHLGVNYSLTLFSITNFWGESVRYRHIIKALKDSLKQHEHSLTTDNLARKNIQLETQLNELQNKINELKESIMLQKEAKTKGAGVHKEKILLKKHKELLYKLKKQFNNKPLLLFDDPKPSMAHKTNIESYRGSIFELPDEESIFFDSVTSRSINTPQYVSSILKTYDTNIVTPFLCIALHTTDDKHKNILENRLLKRRGFFNRFIFLQASNDIENDQQMADILSWVENSTKYTFPKIAQAIRNIEQNSHIKLFLSQEANNYLNYFLYNTLDPIIRFNTTSLHSYTSMQKQTRVQMLKLAGLIQLYWTTDFTSKIELSEFNMQFAGDLTYHFLLNYFTAMPATVYSKKKYCEGKMKSWLAKHSKEYVYLRDIHRNFDQTYSAGIVNAVVAILEQSGCLQRLTPLYQRTRGARTSLLFKVNLNILRT